MNYKKVNPKNLKKHGKMINGELHLDEGIYCINTPAIDIELCNIKLIKNVPTKD